MSAAVLDHSPDLKRLQNEGYEIEINNSHCIIHNVPYLDENLNIQKGILVSSIVVVGDTTKYNGDHVIYFHGSMPYRNTGENLAAIVNSPCNKEMAGVYVNYMFSNKPAQGYKDYYDKITNYVNILTNEAQVIDASATAKTFKRVVSVSEDVLQYSDTNSHRAVINHYTDKFRNQKIAIIGLGGTGSYILDQVAKTPVSEIHLFDGDVFCQHNAFRAPGAPNSVVFEEQPFKTDYYKEIYSNMHKGIVSHPHRIYEKNIDNLSVFDFVFLAIDSGEHKKVITDYLFGNNIKFIDTGIDVNDIDGRGLIGMTRTTIVSDANYDVISDNICFQEVDGDNLYQSNIQTADLNALCALNAVIEWKKLMGFYIDNNKQSNYVYTTNDGEFK